jgi:hypothetical protein
MMTEQSSGHGRSDDWSRGGYVPGEQYAGEQYYDAGAAASSRSGSGTPGQGGATGTARPGQGTPGHAGAAGPGQPTTPIWQATPGQATPSPGQATPSRAGAGQAAPGQAGAGQAAPGRAGYGQDAYGQAAYGQAAYGQGAYGQGAYGQGATPPSGAPATGSRAMGRSQAADARGFLGALFDFSFTSLVTTKIIKVLYVLILVLVSISALVFTIAAFRLSAAFGLLTLVIGDPLFILIVMAFWRLVLESFVVRFRIAEDVRELRERSER